MLKSRLLLSFLVVDEAMDAANDVMSKNSIFLDHYICYTQKDGEVDYTEPSMH